MPGRTWARRATAVSILGVSLAGCAPASGRPAAPPTTAPTPASPVASPPSPRVEPGVRLLRGRAETVDAGYPVSAGGFLRVTRAAIAPGTPRPGQTVTLTATIVALVPEENAPVTVRETWAVLFAGIPLVTLPAREVTLSQGTSEVERTIDLPADAADGEYTVEVAVQAVTPRQASPVKAAAPFTVATAARPAPSSPAPPPGPPASPAAPRESTAPDARTISIRVDSVDVRTGPGTSFRARARIPRNTAVQIIEERSTGRERWYRVRLPNGDDGWIPAAAGGEPR